MSETTVRVTSEFADEDGIRTEQKAEFTVDASFDVVHACIFNKVGNREDLTISSAPDLSTVWVAYTEPGLAYPMAQKLLGDIKHAKEQVDAIVDTDPNKPYHTEEHLDRYRAQASHADI